MKQKILPRSAGRSCTPRCFSQHGLTFRFSNLRDALTDIHPRP